MKRLVSRFLVMTLLASGAGVGCGSDAGTPDAGTTARGPRGTGMTVTQMVGAAGGSVTLEGTTLTVPPGALSADLSLSITSSASDAPAGYQTSTPVFRFGPAGTMFGAPVTVTLTVPDGTGASSIYWSRTNGSGFDALPTTRFGNQLTASVAHFSDGFVAPTPVDPADGGACSDTVCGTACVQTGSDPANCGACGNVCGAGFRCVMGFCFAPAVRDAGPDTGVDVPVAVDTGGPLDVGVDPGSDVPVAADVVVVMDRGGPLDVGVDPGSDVPVDVGFDAGVADVVIAMDRGGPLDVGVDPGCGPATAGGGGGSCTGSQTCGGVAFALSCSPMGCSCTRNGVATTTFAVGTTCGSPTSINAALTAQCRGIAVDAGMVDVPVVDVGFVDVGFVDTGMLDAAADTSVSPLCDGGTVCSGACRLLAADPVNCGGCGVVCPVPATMVATCTAGACGSRCATNNRDCNAIAADGCEVNVATDPANCGRCGGPCDIPHATPACVAGGCAIGSCAAGFADCDRALNTGCEVDLRTSATNCGRCGTACGVDQVCMSGACVVSCPSGRANCGGVCADLQTNIAHCGACGNACGAGRVCSGGVCM